MPWIELFQWWNLIFDLPFVAALIPLFLQATGAAHLGHGGHGVHVGHAGGLHGHHVHLPHLGHHVETVTHAGPATHEVHGAVTHHGHAEHHVESQGMLSRAFGLLGVGKVPIMMVFSSFSFVWGFTGIVCNQLFGKVFPLPVVFIWPSILIALTISLILTGALSSGFNRLMPSVETYGTPEYELTGRTGKALYEINTNSGAAVVLDNTLNRVQVKCRTEDGEVIPTGSKISLMRYDEPTQIFFVRQATEAPDSSSTQRLIK